MSAPTCPSEEAGVFQRESQARAGAASSYQPGGPAWFLSEFGGSDDYANLTAVADDADQSLIGWTYWQWKNYNDPYGSADEGIIEANGSMDLAKAGVLSRTYAQAVAGTPVAMSYDPSSADFTLTYRSDPTIHTPTVIFVPVALHYPHGYCVAVQGGGQVTSPAGSTHLTVEGPSRLATVTVQVRPC